LASFFCFSIAVYKKEISLSFIPKWIIVSFLIAIASMFIATTISLFEFHIFAPDALREYARILACCIVLLETVCIGFQEDYFVKISLYMLALASYILPLMLYAS